MPWLAMAINRGPAAAAFGLEIEGKFAGLLSSFDGGDPFADVVETTHAGSATDKHIANVHYADLVVTSPVADGPLAAWVSTFLEGKALQHDGAVILLDLNRQQLRRLEWKRGAIIAVAFPALDGSGKEAGLLTITIRPEVVREVGGGGQAAGVPQVRTKAWTVGNFALSMTGIDCSRVVRIEPLVVTQTYLVPTSGREGPQPGPVHVSDLVVTVADTGASDFARWAEDFIVAGNNSKSHEKDATVRYLAANLRDQVASLNIMSTGIFRVDHVSDAVGVARTLRVKFSMYAKQVRWVTADDPAAPPTASTERPRPGRDLRDMLGTRMPAAEVVRRLQEPSAQPEPGGVDGQRQLGRDVGFAWAQRQASQSELSEVAAADEQDWSTLRLPGGHSLTETLAATVNLQLLSDGGIELPRDALSEGLLSGVRQALTELSAHISDSASDTPPSPPTDDVEAATAAMHASRALPPDQQREIARDTVRATDSN